MYPVTLYYFFGMARAIKIIWFLATVTSSIELSVKIVTKSPKVGPIFMFSIVSDCNLRLKCF
jgi:hypothetical protein